MKFNKSLVGVAVAGALLVPSVASALTITAYTSVSSFLAGMQASAFYPGSWEIETFNDDTVLTPGLSITGNQVTLFDNPVPDFGASVGKVMSGVVDGTDTITFSFGGREMYAFGAHWNLANAAVGGPGSNITLNLTSGGTFSFVDFIPNSTEGTFKGFVSDTPFSSVVLSEGSGCCQETFQLDNLKYAQAVPEPETYAMLIAGLGLMGFVARRRKAAAKA